MTVVARNEVAPWRRGLDGVIVFPPDATDPLWLAAPGDTIFELTVRQLPSDLRAPRIAS